MKGARETGPAWFALLSGALLLGFAAVFVRWAQAAGPMATGFYRMALALGPVAFLAFAAPGASPAPGRPGARGMRWAVLGGLCFTFDLALWNTAIRHTSAASATLLVGLAPLWVAVATVIFLKTRLRLRAWVGLGFALAGAACLGLAKGARPGASQGELMALLASLGYGAYTLSLARARESLDARRALFFVVLSSALVFGVLALIRGEALGGFPPHTWLALTGLGLVVQVLAWWLIAWGLGHLPAASGSLGLLLQQVATVFLGWGLLGERPGGLQGLGILAILVGIGLAVSSPPVPRRRGSEPTGKPAAE